MQLFASRRISSVSTVRNRKVAWNRRSRIVFGPDSRRNAIDKRGGTASWLLDKTRTNLVQIALPSKAMNPKLSRNSTFTWDILVSRPGLEPGTL